mmetsp:Transcript_43936/g.121579  ORF Transcript_43936/g.121579 Transcript_43936/m.121579 type:complete len:234 (-) Transcript_43936:872-1573(-)
MKGGRVGHARRGFDLVLCQRLDGIRCKKRRALCSGASVEKVLEAQIIFRKTLYLCHRDAERKLLPSLFASARVLDPREMVLLPELPRQLRSSKVQKGVAVAVQPRSLLRREPQQKIVKAGVALHVQPGLCLLLVERRREVPEDQGCVVGFLSRVLGAASVALCSTGRFTSIPAGFRERLSLRRLRVHRVGPELTGGNIVGHGRVFRPFGACDSVGQGNKLTLLRVSRNGARGL